MKRIPALGLGSRAFGFSALLGLAAILAGCTVGPDYHRPQPLGGNVLPPSFGSNIVSATNAQWKAAEPAAHLPRGSWWTLFEDRELNRLETMASSNNQQVAASVARFNQARALVGVARSDLLPHFSLLPSYQRERTSANQSDRGLPAGVGHSFNNFTIPLDATWELDLWGRVRRALEAARARMDASADDIGAINLSIQAEVAIDYFSVRLLDVQHGLVRQSIEAYRRSLDLTRNRRAGGVVSDLDVAQADTQLQSAQAQLPDIELRRARLAHALALLCGQPATTFVIQGDKTDLETIPSLPLSLPSELLERRPDISAAERRMIAANAEIGVAQAAFYPRVTVGGSAGLQSINLGSLFEWPSRFWAVGPTLELPLFTGGRNRARLEAARAGYDETVANYRQTVLASFQEVEDQLAAQRLLATQIQSEAAALRAARRTLEIANNRYQAGLVTYLEVATAQTAALTRELTVGQLQAERLAATASLAKAMGGGWAPTKAQ
jgi:multidrug efflux system outer membrane protein